MYVCSQTFGHEIASAHHYLYVEDSSLKRWSYSSSEIHSLFKWNVIVRYCIHENPPWDPVLHRLNPASTFTSFRQNIRVKIISLWYLSWGIVTNIFCAFLICVIFLLLSFHQCSILIFQLSAISAISAVMCHYMKYFPFSIWATWAPSYPISFNHLTWYWSTVTNISNMWQRQLFWYGSSMNPSLYFKGEIPKITLWKMWQYSV